MLILLTSIIIEEDDDILPSDVVLFEEDLNSKQGYLMCRDFYNRGYCREIWAVKITDTSSLYSDSQYVSWIQEYLEKENFGITVKPFILNAEHPVTVNKTKALTDSLVKKGFTSVILVTNAFHSRRSLKVYRKLLEGTGITIKSKVYYSQASREDWWKTSYGFRYVIPEILKYFFYMARGLY